MAAAFQSAKTVDLFGRAFFRLNILRFCIKR
eukprot:CAMPEP_0195304660 /NCGR_PEP_ID=MMETSP0707-20130614/34888_1 /TAXON_ID=33640 /ORGANISM="Asterionellopsis glacialis, Strain CCMP134" /LENGTH=30 /DNA_ID= /DNA_START= /DNA_END= /DNA_ORIENTATION=